MSFRLEKRRRLDDQRIDDWLITYADMITLILCFFAIILSVSVFKKYKLAQAKQQVMEQFAAPKYHDWEAWERHPHNLQREFF